MGVCLPLTALSAIAIWVGVLRRLVRATSPERQQLAWFVCAAGPLLAILCLGAPAPVVAVSLCLVPVVVTVGVLRYRLPGITALMRRGLVFGSLTALVIAIHPVAANTIGAVPGPSWLPGVLAAAVVAIGLAPARERLRRTVDRWILGSSHDPLRALSGLGDRSADADGADDADEHGLLPAALDAVMRTLHAPAIRVTASDGTVLAALGPVGSPGCPVELRLAGRTLGTMTVADRTPGEPYDRDDMRLLGALAQQVAVVVRAHELTAIVAAQRDHLVDATRTERDRIREDLRNGLGPSLADMGLGLQAALDGLARGDTEAVGPLLTRTLDEVTAAVGEIRRIIDSLRVCSRHA
ncbi:MULTISPECIES: GAF domain-containing protein [unclassified Streptomyces]|uniref:GAF domain-containing protein n=1 Tax=unclassified Streptomyces TaxID=2593676 RepID=UPI00364AFE08